MKKKILALIAACILLCLPLTGCAQTGETMSKVESEAEKLLEEGKKILEGALAEIQKDAKKVEEAVQMEGKAALEILQEDEKTLKYKFTVAEEAAATEIGELEKKAAGLETEIQAHLQTLKDKGVKDVQAIVQFVDKEGKELYQKIFK